MDSTAHPAGVRGTAGEPGNLPNPKPHQVSHQSVWTKRWCRTSSLNTCECPRCRSGQAALVFLCQHLKAAARYKVPPLFNPGKLYTPAGFYITVKASDKLPQISQVLLNSVWWGPTIIPSTQPGGANHPKMDVRLSTRWMLAAQHYEKEKPCWPSVNNWVKWYYQQRKSSQIEQS